MGEFPVPVVASPPNAEVALRALDEWVRERRTDRPVLLIGFLRQGNLGLGYLSPRCASSATASSCSTSNSLPTKFWPPRGG